MHPRALAFIALAFFLVLGLVACSGQEAQTDSAATQAPPEASAPEGDSSAAPSPIASPVPAPALVNSRTPASGDAIAAPGAAFSLPQNWQSQTPSSSMRLAQAAIPGSGGPGQLTVFYFGPGGGGGVDANIDRWVGQMDVAPGSQPSRETFEVGAYRVTWVDVEGTIKPSTMGVGPTEPQPGSRLLGAVIEGAEGPWFFKATGPSQTLDEERESFLQMLRSVRTP